MEREIDDDICRYADVRAPGYLATMVFSNPHDGRAVLQTPKVSTGYNPLCPGPRSIDGEPCRRREALISQLHAVQNGKSRAEQPSDVLTWQDEIRFPQPVMSDHRLILHNCLPEPSSLFPSFDKYFIIL